ncbi:MAG: hypothetical protein RSA64_06335 [Christensenellaceae bacterium]
MKKFVLIVLTIAIALSVFVAGCAPAAPAASAVPEPSEEQATKAPTEAPTEAPTSSPSAEASASALDIVGTEWEVYNAIDADGSNVANVPYKSYEFSVNNEVTEYTGHDSFSTGKYELDGNQVMMTFDERKLSGTFQNGELEIYEGKGAYVYKADTAPTLAGTAWDFVVETADGGQAINQALDIKLDFKTDGTIAYIKDGKTQSGTYTQDGKNFTIVIEDLTTKGVVTLQQALLFGEESTLAFQPQIPDVAGMRWELYRGGKDGDVQIALYDSALIFGTDGSVENLTGGETIKGTYEQNADSILINLEGSEPISGTIAGFEMSLMMPSGETEFFSPVF